MKKLFKLMCLFAALFVVACDTPEPTPTPKPEPEPTPTEGAVTMTDIEILDVLDIAAYFTVTVTNMDDFGFVVIKAEEYNAEEVTADYVIENSGDFMYEDYARGNYSWEEPMPIPFEEDLEDETDYVVVAAAKNSTSQVLKSATFTTLKQEIIVEKMRFNPTSLSVISAAPDYYLTMSTALYEMKIHLVGGDTFGGHYDNCDEDTVQGFVAEGSSFKALDLDNNWIEYGELDPTIGNIDFYENVVTGKWETYGSFCFAVPGEENSWLTLEIEIPEGKDISGITRTEPYEFIYPITDRNGEIIPLSAEAEKSADNANVWNLTVANDKDNTFTFAIDLGEDKAYIPSGTYTLGNNLTIDKMIVNNVSTAAAESSTYESKVIINYDEATEETFISVDVMVKAGTAVAKINNAGPFKLYEEVTEEAEVYTEGEMVNSMAVWATWDEIGKCWWLECFGLKFNMNLYFMIGTDAAEHLPAGRYYLRSTDPGDGSLWIDATKSYAQVIRTSDQLPFVCDTEDAYIDVTAERDAEAEYWRHTMVGTLKTTNGAYIINLNFVKENASIY